MGTITESNELKFKIGDLAGTMYGGGFITAIEFWSFECNLPRIATDNEEATELHNLFKVQDSMVIRYGIKEYEKTRFYFAHDVHLSEQIQKGTGGE